MPSTINLSKKNGQSVPVSIPASVFASVNLNNSPAQVASDVWSVIVKQSDPFVLVAGTVVNKGDLNHTLT